MSKKPLETWLALNLMYIKANQADLAYNGAMKPDYVQQAVAPLAKRSAAEATATARALFALTKPRLAFFTILTAIATYVATADGHGLLHACVTLFGASCSAGGALSLNQWLERELDARMERTCQRPLPARQVSPRSALLFSASLSFIGILTLGTMVSPISAFLALTTILVYGFVYTPLKRRTRWATEIGALSGALPPLIGTAATGNPTAPIGISLFLIILIWQMPHFYAIGWRYRADYRNAGFRLLSTRDYDGRKTARWTLGYSLALLALPIVLYGFGLAALPLLIAATLAGSDLTLAAFRFCRSKSEQSSKRLFFATIRYLPIALTGACIPY
ncbi:heme o synthase [Pelagicoccus enzymogenes]|nr:heme o synthase [Pelagicoccus enzymogenes]